MLFDFVSTQKIPNLVWECFTGWLTNFWIFQMADFGELIPNFQTYGPLIHFISKLKFITSKELQKKNDRYDWEKEVRSVWAIKMT